MLLSLIAKEIGINIYIFSRHMEFFGVVCMRVVDYGGIYVDQIFELESPNVEINVPKY